MRWSVTDNLTFSSSSFASWLFCIFFISADMASSCALSWSRRLFSCPSCSSVRIRSSSKCAASRFSIFCFTVKKINFNHFAVHKHQSHVVYKLPCYIKAMLSCIPLSIKVALSYYQCIPVSMNLASVPPLTIQTSFRDKTLELIPINYCNCHSVKTFNCYLEFVVGRYSHSNKILYIIMATKYNHLLSGLFLLI